MTDYDFHTLNDKEFEILCVDLLGLREGKKIERFKPGKDQGVDGRYFADGNGEVVVQCKHWQHVDFRQMLRELKKTEAPKVAKLAPAKYLLALSIQLSRKQKDDLQAIFAPYVRSPADIVGREDINDLLAKHPDVEKRHYKLWLSSTTVLQHLLNKPIFERSAFALEEIVAKTKRYAATQNHSLARRKLDELGVLIICGEPGVGKTTLAEHICLEHTASGYAFFQIAEDIAEAEQAFVANERQLFYFDDFLGRNYLEALSGHEGNRIGAFIKRISRDRSKKFVLTSRSTILNQGKVLIDNYDHQNLTRNELIVNASQLTEMDKAQILYNHIWHSQISGEFVEEVYRNKRYHAIIKHHNFNPRLIAYLTESTRLLDVEASNYWDHVKSTLDNPKDVWTHPFDVQLDASGRAIVLLTSLNGRSIPENELRESYLRLIKTFPTALDQRHGDFSILLRHLAGSFLRRTIGKQGDAQIDLLNPSIGDFLIHRYKNDPSMLAACLWSLRSLEAAQALRNWRGAKLLSDAHFQRIASMFLASAENEGLANFEPELLCQMLLQVVSGAPFNKQDCALYRRVVPHALEGDPDWHCSAIIKVLSIAIDSTLVQVAQCHDFFNRAVQEEHLTEDELERLVSLADSLEASAPSYSGARTRIEAKIVEYLAAKIDEEISEQDVFSDLSPVWQPTGWDGEDEPEFDHDDASACARTHIEQRLSNLKVVYRDADVNHIFSKIDLDGHISNLMDSLSTSPRTYVGENRPVSTTLDDIDDLFQRAR